MQQNGCPPQPLLAEVDPLRQASRQLVRELGVLDGRPGGIGIPFSQGHSLVEIGRRGTMTAGELAAVLNLDKSTTSRTVAALVRAGLVAARPDQGDRRRRLLGLTARGRRKLATLDRMSNQQVHEALALLRDEDRAAVVRGLDLYARALGRRRVQQELSIRPMTPRDDAAVAAIIRDVMTEHGASGPGFAIHDPEVEAMSASYAAPGHGYWVVVRRGRVVGGGGFAPLTGGEPGVCELRKMYFRPEVRGTGMGARLLGHVLAGARRAGHRTCYLETLVSMARARRLYESFGFQRLSGPMGSTGHFAVDAWYALDLTSLDAPPQGRSGVEKRSDSN
jgi:putative acetyltransferase